MTKPTEDTLDGYTLKISPKEITDPNLQLPMLQLIKITFNTGHLPLMLFLLDRSKLLIWNGFVPPKVLLVLPPITLRLNKTVYHSMLSRTYLKLFWILLDKPLIIILIFVSSLNSNNHLLKLFTLTWFAHSPSRQLQLFYRLSETLSIRELLILN